MEKERFKIIPTVYLVLLRGNEILLARRYNTGFRDGEYSFPAGHLDGNETILDTLVREAKEEIGIDVKCHNLKLVHLVHRKEPNEERVSFFFLAKEWQGEPKIMEPEKCDDLRWFPINALPENTIPYVKQAIGCIIQGEFYSEFGW